MFSIISWGSFNLLYLCPAQTPQYKLVEIIFCLKNNMYLRLLIYCLVVILIIPVMLAKWPLLFSSQSVLAVAVLSTVIANIFLIAWHYQSHRTVLQEWIIAGVTWIAWDGNAFLNGPWSQEVAYLTSHSQQIALLIFIKSES